MSEISSDNDLSENENSTINDSFDRDLSDNELDGYDSSYAFDCEFDHPNPNTFDSFRNQNFSLPSTMVHYILKNPKSAKGLEKIQKTCKYFFSKNKIIVLKENVTAEGDFLISYGIYFHIVPNFKYWLTKSITGYGNGNIMKYVYRCSFISFSYGDHDFTWNEFNFLLGDKKIRYFYLEDVNIYDDQGNLVPCNQILEKVPFVKEFTYANKNEVFTNKVFENLSSLTFNSKIKKIHLWIHKLSSDSNFSTLCKFSQNNAEEKFAFRVRFFTGENILKNRDDLKNQYSSWIKKDKLSILILDESIDIYKGKEFGQYF